MKEKFSSIWRLSLALVFVLGFSLIPAVAMGNGTSTYAGYRFSSSGTVTWDKNTKDTGSYSVKLDENGTSYPYIEFIPAPGTKMSDLDAEVIAEWSFRYKMITQTSGGPNMELRFTSPTFNAVTGAQGNAFWGHADVNTQVPVGLTPDVWATENAVTNPQVQTYFNDPVDGTPGAFDSSPFFLLSETLAAIDAYSVMTDHGSSAADWELTRVRIELWESTDRVSYIDDVTIDGVTYTMEPMVLDDTFYKTTDTVIVSVFNGNNDPMAIDTVTVSANSTTDTVGDPTVTLTETGSNTGIFTGLINLIAAAPANRALDQIVVSTGGTVAVKYSGDWGAGSQTLDFTDPPTATVDGTAPVIIIVSPVASSNITDATPEIKATYSDVGYGVDNATAVLKVDGVAKTPQTKTVTEIIYTPTDNLTEGSHTITVDVSDLVGNAATQKSWSFTVDTIAPAITGQVATPSVIPPSVSSNITFTANVTDATSGINTVKIDLSSINGSATQAMLDNGVAPDVTPGDGVYTAKIAATVATEGIYTLTVTATDYASNTKTADITLGVWSDITDPVITSPTLTYLYGLSSARPSDNVTISANVTDDVAMGTVTAASIAFTATVNMTAVGNIYTGTPTVKSGAASGNYTVTITATDAKGNEATDTSLTLTVNPAAAGADIVLSEDWNLISLPLVPTSTNITTILADVSDNVTQVRTWVYEGGVLTEKVWINSGPADFTTMTDGLGYWIEMTAANTLTIQGTVMPPAPQTPRAYQVYAGWNLIGFKALSESTAEAYLGTAVSEKFERMYGYDAEGGVYTVVTLTTPNLQPGQGYWLAVNAAGTIYP